MTEISIRYVGATTLPRDTAYPFSPCFHAERDSNLLLKAWIQLDLYASDQLQTRLSAQGIEDVEGTVQRAMLQYGVRRLGQTVRGAAEDDFEFPDPSAVWRLDCDDLPTLLALIVRKTCAYQVRDGRDYFCTTADSDDVLGVYEINGRRSAPTSIPLCNECDLPSTDYLCSSLSHPRVEGTFPLGGISKQVSLALCNEGRPEVDNPRGCHAGGHECWRRFVEIADHASAPHSAPTDLPDAIDTLGAYWRLAFGKQQRLVSLHTTSGPAELTLGCTTREEFKSRLSALADLFDKLVVGDGLLPDGLTDEQKKGSLNRIESCLKHQLPNEYEPSVMRALRTLRQVRRVRVAMQHTGGGTAVAIELSKLGIHDVPLDWSAAWNQIRAVCADAVHDLRKEIGRWVESTI